MRDPSICAGPDGTFHMVWTTGWGDKGIGIAHSKDLIDWSEQTFLEVMKHEPDAMNCWAPEIYYDDATQQYMIFWSTTIPGRFPKTDAQSGGKIRNHRIYAITTTDFETYTKPRLFYDGGFNVIDGAIVKDNNTYVMFVKDETFEPEPKKNIRMATAKKAEGPYSPASAPFSPDWVEGPTAIKIGDYWYVYYDAYRRNRYEGARSTDFQSWEPITDMLQFPCRIRHGSIFAVPPKILTALLDVK
jgi:beta-xylosidase